MGRLLARWVDLVHHTAVWVVVAATLGCALLLHYTVTHLGVDTSTANMISARLPWRQTFIDFRQAFPQLTANIIVVIDADTPELAEDAQEQLGAALQANARTYHSVNLVRGGDFFHRNGLLYLSTQELDAFADRVAAAQPFLRQLSDDLSLQTLFALLVQTLDADAALSDTERIQWALAEAFAASSDGRFHRLSWRELMASPRARPGAHQRLLLLRPRADDAQPRHRRVAVEGIRDAVERLGLGTETGVRVRLTGAVAMEYEELASVQAGTALAGVLSMMLVIVVLFVILRSLRLVLASVLSLLAGLIATGAFAAVAVGRLNLISIAFAVLYIGLAADFAIHFCARCRELLDAGHELRESLRQSAADVGASLLICASTTAIGFYAFIPTDFAGVAQLGLISGTGMFISLAVSLTVLPALISVMPPPPRTGAAPPPLHVRTLALVGAGVLRHRTGVRAATIVASALAAVSLSGVSFDDNPLNLRDRTSESVQTFLELVNDPDNIPLTLSVLTSSHEGFSATREELLRLETVASVRSIDDFVPSDQQEKLAVIDELAFIMGGELAQPQRPRIDPDTDFEHIREFARVLSAHLARVGLERAPAAAHLSAQLQDWITATEDLPRTERSRRVGELVESVLATLPRQLAALNAALRAEAIDVDALPESLQALWVSVDGRRRLEVVPSNDVSDDAELGRFVRSVRAAVPAATGMPVVQIEAGRAVIDAFRFAFLSAFGLIFVILLALLRSLRDALAVVFQLLLAAALTGAAAVVFGIEFNFANIIALPLLLGMGVDSAIHMAHRRRAAPPADGNLLGTSTGRAVVFSVLTTIFSFGTLALSAHAGTASMGLLLTLGMIMTLVCTLVVLPALLSRATRR
ncbi:MAG: MMPL family transporter [Gammaproteobacteria bacterium]|nr:MMPL family transporter [Gammaproteobacteria bacterium]